MERQRPVTAERDNLSREVRTVETRPVRVAFDALACQRLQRALHGELADAERVSERVLTDERPPGLAVDVVRESKSDDLDCAVPAEASTAVYRVDGVGDVFAASRRVVR